MNIARVVAVLAQVSKSPSSALAPGDPQIIARRVNIAADREVYRKVLHENRKFYSIIQSVNFRFNSKNQIVYFDCVAINWIAQI